MAFAKQQLAMAIRTCISVADRTFIANSYIKIAEEVLCFPGYPREAPENTEHYVRISKTPSPIKRWSNDVDVICFG